MSNHLAVQPHGEPSLASQLIEILFMLCDDALDYLWSLITRKSKLERLPSNKLRPSRILEIEKFLTKRLSVHFDKMFRTSEDCETLLAEGSVSARGEQREELKKRLETVITAIDAYEELRSQVEATLREKYNSNNPSHEERLLELWKLLVPHETLENRIGKQWRFIGFQGDDPATDFRGMGILSLDQLIYLAKNYPDHTQKMLSISHHPQFGFPLAVAGINFTAVTRQLLASGKLKKLFYQSSESMDMTLFHETYCKIFISFVDFWKDTKPTSVMEFNPVRAVFERKLFDELRKDDCDIDSISK